MATKKAKQPINVNALALKRAAARGTAIKPTAKKIAVLKTNGRTVAPVIKSRTGGSNNHLTGTPNTVDIRMYCIGTGDCFIIKFFDKEGKRFTMMIDCGCCVGEPSWFDEYVHDLADYVERSIDLLVVTHEHQDHVNGFQKWEELFAQFTFKEAWFAWTENPDDPGGDAAELLKKRKSMKGALSNAMAQIKKRGAELPQKLSENFFKARAIEAHQNFVNGLDSLAAVNLDDEGKEGNELAGMRAIKDILKKKGTKTRYLGPGETVSIDRLAGIKFHVLGPPRNRDFIFKDGKEGKDVFKKNMAINESALAAKAFNIIDDAGNIEPEDIPFADEYIAYAVNGDEANLQQAYITESWRNIDDEWLMSAGSLAIRLNSHINNTSLALAIESVKSEKVLLMPGDAEYGSWASWHLVENWKKKGRNGKHLVEDLLNRTVFYKVGHHLSYNGTALEKGIDMMASGDLVAVASLDLNRIAKKWKTTMPNPHLMKELIRKTGGRFFIMDETDIKNPPSETLDPQSLGKKVYQTKMRADGAATLYKQFTMAF